jgi:hypothetical protein
MASPAFADGKVRLTRTPQSQQSSPGQLEERARNPRKRRELQLNCVSQLPQNWFAYFRFYNPTEAYFDRSCPLPDFEEVVTTPTTAAVQ